NKELVYETQKEVFYERKYAYFKPFWLVKQNFKNNIKTSYSNSIISLKDKFNKYKNYGLKDWMNFTIWKIPLYLWFVIIPVIGLMIGFFAWDENLPWFWNGKTAPNIMSKDMKTMAFGLGIMLVMAAIFGSFFGKLPIWKKYFGGAVIGCLVTGSLFVQFVPTFKKDQPMYQAVEAWFKTGDFLSFYISILLAGAVMTMNRKLILKSVTNFFVIITIGCIVAAVFVAVTALIIDYPIGAAINNVLFPAIADGNGGGVLPMSKIIDGIEAGKDGLTGKGGDWYTGAIAVSTLCSVLSIVMAALLSELGKSKPSLSGNGKLMIGQPRFFEKPGKIDYRNAAGTLLLICVLFMLSMVFEKLIFTTTLLSKITTIPGAHIPAFAWMVVFCLILNLSGLIPNKTKLAAKEINQFVVKQMTWMLMIGVGMISVHFEQFIKIFTQWQKIILCFAVVIGITIGTMAFAKLFNFFAIESALTAGLCMSAQGGSGVIGVLGASNRMELMAYGQLACRIMGSVVLLVAAPLFEVWKASLI
ncbi:MAG: 2-hydroxycarboxylate transporter family protein, partial [Mycoplasma sp.]|nr:2-hydroxycarboxylate transporter family protein [Mycoplasma sp.]